MHLGMQRTGQFRLTSAPVRLLVEHRIEEQRAHAVSASRSASAISS